MLKIKLIASFIEGCRMYFGKVDFVVVEKWYYKLVISIELLPQATQEEGIQGSHGGRICLYYRLLTGNEVRLCKGQMGLGLSAETRAPKFKNESIEKVLF